MSDFSVSLGRFLPAEKGHTAHVQVLQSAGLLCACSFCTDKPRVRRPRDLPMATAAPEAELGFERRCLISMAVVWQ